MSTVVETSRISFLEIPRRYALSGWHYWVNIYIIALFFVYFVSLWRLESVLRCRFAKITFFCQRSKWKFYKKELLRWWKQAGNLNWKGFVLVLLGKIGFLVVTICCVIRWLAFGKMLNFCSFFIFCFFFCKIVVFLQGNVRVLLYNYITALFFTDL